MLIKITPVPKPRTTQRDRWAKRPVVERYYAFADELRLRYNQQLPSSLDLVFMMPMPKSWSKKKQEKMYLQPHQQEPDIDNLIKAVMDSLCEDDSYVFSVSAVKFWDKEGGILIDEKSVTAD